MQNIAGSQSMLRTIALTTAAIVALAAAFVAHEWYSRPFIPRLLFERVFFRFLLDQPELLSLTGALRPTGLRFYQSQLTDITDDANERTFSRLADDLTQLEGYDQTSLSASEQRSKEILAYFLESTIALNKFHSLEYLANPITGHHTATLDLLTQFHPFEDERDVADYLKRVENLPEKINTLSQLVRQRAAHGIVMPLHPLLKSIDVVHKFTENTGESNVLCSTLEKARDHVTPAVFADSLKSCVVSVQTRVIPAFEGLSQTLASLRDQSPDAPGLWIQPHGSDYYQALVRYHTSTDKSPEYWHHTGINDVARIQSEIVHELIGAGYLCDGASYADAKRVIIDKAEYFDDGVSGRDNLLARFQEIINDESNRIPQLIKNIQIAPVHVFAIDRLKQHAAPLAHYVPGSFDGGRAGSFYVNTGNLRSLPKHQLKTLAYHEAVPGHHLQITIQQQLKGVPTFRRAVPFTAYQEGWALYAEWLAFNHGENDDPMSHVGQLEYELLRAVRLVVDTGIHYAKWTREQALDYFVENTGRTRDEAEIEVDRYSVLPAQALAYKAGMMTIMDLRSQAIAALGNNFDESAFHHIILDDGPRPLTMVESDVATWLSSQRK